MRHISMVESEINDQLAMRPTEKIVNKMNKQIEDKFKKLDVELNNKMDGVFKLQENWDSELK